MRAAPSPATFTDALRSELIHDEIDVHLTMVQLPAVNTPQLGWSENKLVHAVAAAFGVGVVVVASALIARARR